MKKSQQIIGLPIISIAEGNQVGKVKNFIVNGDKGSIDYFVVDSGNQVLDTGVVPAGNVLGIGEYAMTILTPEAICDITRLPAAIELLQKNITVRGTRILTKKGSLIGEAGDIYFDVDNACSIVGVEYIAEPAQKVNRLIPRSSIITFGKTLLVVEDDVLGGLLDDPSGFTAPGAAEEQVKTQDIPEDNMLKLFYDEEIETVPDAEPAPAVQPQKPEAARQEQKSTAAELFEERQKQYLKGRKATKSITDKQGAIIIRSGEAITDQVMEKVKNCGKLIELVMNNEA